MPSSVELRQGRLKLVTEARGIYKKAEDEKRSPTAEERQQWDKIMGDVDRLEGEARDQERMEIAEKSLEASAGRVTTPATPANTGTRKNTNPRASDEYRAAFGSFLRGGYSNLMPNEARSVEEIRALSADSPTQAGYLLAPQEFYDNLIKFVNNIVYIRGLATKFTVTNAASMGAPSLDADPADADWTSELNTGTEDSTMAFGKRELFPRPVAKRIKVSNKLLRMKPDVEAIVRERLGYKFGVTEEKAFMTGNGQNQPLGIFTPSANGISTGRDIATGTAATLKADDLIACKYNLKQQYMMDKSLRFVTSRPTMQLIRQLKDSNNQYLWQPSGLGSNLSTDGLDQILEVPTVMSEYAPNGGSVNASLTTGAYLGIFTVLRYYWICDAESMTVQRLGELYAETNQTGFIGRLEVDAMPVLEEASSRLKVS